MEAKDRTTTFLPGLPSQSHFPLPALTHLHSSYTNLVELPKPDKLEIEITGGFGKTCEFLKGQPGVLGQSHGRKPHSSTVHGTLTLLETLYAWSFCSIFPQNIHWSHVSLVSWALTIFSSDIVKESPNLLLFWPILYTGAILVFLKCQFGYLRRKKSFIGSSLFAAIST